MKHKKLLICIVFLFFGLIGYTQSVIATSGSDISGSGGTVNYTVGQITYNLHLDTTGSVSEGVHQAYEVSIVLGLEENNVQLELSTYPNPTANSIHLIIKNIENEKLSYQLYNIQGKLLEKNKINNSNTIINMGHLPTSIYFLKVTTNQKLTKTFKIIKK